MKKFQILVPVLAVVLAVSSAFTKAPVLTVTEYYTLDGTHFAVKGAGDCMSGSLYCTYIANTPTPNLNNPADFTPQGLADRVWQPINP